MASAMLLKFIQNYSLNVFFGKFSSYLKLFSILTALALVASGCGPNSSTINNNTGAVATTLSWGGNTPSPGKTVAKAAAGVTTIRIFVTGEGMTNVQKDFSSEGGQCVIDGVLIGDNRTVKAQGLHSSGLLIYQGEIKGINVQAGQITDAGTIIMQPLAPTGYIDNGNKTDVNLLWKPQVYPVDNTVNANLYRDNRKIILTNFAPWPVPENPTWMENPYNNGSWEFYYQSLVWLSMPQLLFETTSDSSYLSQMKHYVFSWISNNQTPNNTMAWFDHSIVYRSAMLTHLYYKYFKNNLTKEEDSFLIDSIMQHGVELEKLLNDPGYKRHNHNMFHAIALFNISAAYPYLPLSQYWKVISRKRIGELMNELIEVSEGISIEQATDYQWTALSLFTEANALLRNFNSDLDQSNINVLHKMVDFAALMRWPNGSMVPIGDTSYSTTTNTVYPLRNYYERGYGSQITNFFLSGTDPEPSDAFFFPRSGYYILRPSYTSDFSLFVDMGPSLFSHGHNDAMNVLLYDNKSPLLIDPGGPYTYDYDDEIKKYFVHARAHNSVVVNNKDYDAGDVTITRYIDSQYYSMLEGFHNKYSGINHKRTVLIIKPNLLVIMDSLTSSNSSNEYDLIYHFPPNFSVNIKDDSNLVLYNAQKTGLSMCVKSKYLQTLQVINGQTTPYIQGWVTPSFGKKVAAPVAQFKQFGQDAWFVTAIKTSLDPELTPVSVSVEVAGNDWKFYVDEPSKRTSIILPQFGNPIITITGS